MKYLHGKDRNSVDVWRGTNNKRVCCVDGCMIKHNKQGYCSKHYREFIESKTCTFEGCKGKTFAKTLCAKHYKQKYRHGEIFRTIYDKNNIIRHNDYAEMKLYNINGDYIGSTIIDLDDVEKVQKYKWHLNSNGYVRSSALNSYLHRYIMDCNDLNYDVDHIFHDSLDNRKSMLRVCRHFENNRNSDKVNSNTGIRGVYYHEGHDRYYASINSKGIKYNSKRTLSIVEAIEYREIMELYLHGEYSPKYSYLIDKYGNITSDKFEKCVSSTSTYNMKG